MVRSAPRTAAQASGRGRSTRRTFALLVVILAALASSQRADAGLNQWTSAGPEGGRINALAIDPQTSGVVYAAASGGGVFKSSTGGNFWTRANAGIGDPFVNALAIDPETPATLQFVTPAGIVAGHVTDVRSFRPLAVNVPLTTPFTASQSSVFTHQRTADDVPGPYVFFMVAVKTGAFAGGRITDDQILRIALAPFSFP